MSSKKDESHINHFNPDNNYEHPSYEDYNLDLIMDESNRTGKEAIRRATKQLKSMITKKSPNKNPLKDHDALSIDEINDALDKTHLSLRKYSGYGRSTPSPPNEDKQELLKFTDTYIPSSSQSSDDCQVNNQFPPPKPKYRQDNQPPSSEPIHEIINDKNTIVLNRRTSIHAIPELKSIEPVKVPTTSISLIILTDYASKNNELIQSIMMSSSISDTGIHPVLLTILECLIINPSEDEKQLWKMAILNGGGSVVYWMGRLDQEWDQRNGTKKTRLREMEMQLENVISKLSHMIKTSAMMIQDLPTHSDGIAKEVDRLTNATNILEKDIASISIHDQTLRKSLEVNNRVLSLSAGYVGNTTISTTSLIESLNSKDTTYSKIECLLGMRMNEFSQFMTLNQILHKNYNKFAKDPIAPNDIKTICQGSRGILAVIIYYMSPLSITMALKTLIGKSLDTQLDIIGSLSYDDKTVKFLKKSAEYKKFLTGS